MTAGGRGNEGLGPRRVSCKNTPTAGLWIPSPFSRGHGLRGNDRRRGAGMTAGGRGSFSAVQRGSFVTMSQL